MRRFHRSPAWQISAGGLFQSECPDSTHGMRIDGSDGWGDGGGSQPGGRLICFPPGQFPRPAMQVKIGDTVRLPGFPGLLKVEDISGALGMVCWTSSTGEVIRGEVFLSQLQPVEWYQGKEGYVAEIGKPVPPPFAEERWEMPSDDA